MPINALYNGWFFFVFGVLLWQILDVSNRRRREVYLISYILCWVVNGTILATIFSSAGPAFFGRIYPGLENPYQPLMSYLAVANEGNPIWALVIQDYLWDVYSTGSLQIGFSGLAGIPALLQGTSGSCRSGISICCSDPGGVGASGLALCCGWNSCSSDDHHHLADG